MFEGLKNVDLVDEMERYIEPDEDIFVECSPNKVPFVFRRLFQPAVVSLIYAILVVIYAIIRNYLPRLFYLSFDWAMIIGFVLCVVFFIKQFYEALVDAKNNYYIITARGVHMLTYDKTLEYTLISYKDMRSVFYQPSILKVGDIYIKENGEVLPTSFIKKFMFKRKGLIGIDEADKVFEVLKQIAIQENETIFFVDLSKEETDVDYFQEVKKYDKEIKVKKEDTLIERRNNQ